MGVAVVDGLQDAKLDFFTHYPFQNCSCPNTIFNYSSLFLFSSTPMHALSIPTWFIHILSVTEWTVAIWLVWIYAKVINNQLWRGFAIAMLPALASAICVCTWHFFDNAPDLEWLGTIQAMMTLLGNCTLMLAAWLLWKQSVQVR